MKIGRIIDLSQEIERREMIHITLTDVGSICSIVGMVFGILAFIKSTAKKK